MRNRVRVKIHVLVDTIVYTYFSNNDDRLIIIYYIHCGLLRTKSL